MIFLEEMMMEKFKVGEKVRLTVKDDRCLLGFHTGDVCEIISNDIDGYKKYEIRRLEDEHCRLCS